MPTVVSQPSEDTACRSFLGSAATLASVILLFCSSTSVSSEPDASDTSRSIPEINWDTTLRKFQFDVDKFVGQRLTVKCTPAPVGQEFEAIYGTDIYPSETPLCLAALHAGKITKDGGVVTIQLNPGISEYRGSVRHGVSSENLPGTSRSFVFIDKANSGKTNEVHLAHIPRVAWDTKFTSTGFAHRHLVGQRFTFRCPPAPQNLRPRLVYGTDDYDFASRICFAALHAGRITKQGGVFTVQMNAGVPRLVGSIRNGFETRSKGGGDRSLSFVDNPVSEENKSAAN